MITADGVEFVRTPDACFENLPDWPYEAQYVEIDGLRQAYVDVGSGDSGETILMLHGQPSWSYLYRKMIPVLVEEGHRVIAMDHLGMGRSDKPIDPDDYTYVNHVERLETFITKLELDQGNLNLFVQDWGSLIGLQVVGTNPDWFDRLVVGNGFLPTLFEVLWQEEQTTSVFMQLIGTPEERVMVTSELTNFPVGLRTPLNTLRAAYEQVVFRDAATGRELARTEDLPRMTQGSNISPGFGGRVYFVGVDGVLYEITVQAE